ncbi:MULTISPECIES: flavin reductase [unclassified Pyramidobacter]|uniref:flavin reductase n=1 Tax=unclassified Pyramidobacter TaxID=2632171 RepID=UPI00098EEA41|nr:MULTISPECIES: flavin reductase [unclassified Pyramidobacter]MCI7403504.1 flavin reductase [Pyramidobacter sp.]MDY3213562.1 flavin reductase [Pyramidobacter sp.]OON89086.1 flavin reductase [Pyramidobacter sp. C12-8]
MDSRIMHQLTYGLFVLSAAENGKDNGCIINTVTQVSAAPAHVTISVCKQNYTHDMIARTGRFNVAILDITAPFDLFQRFGFQSGRDADKFAGVETIRTANGILIPTEHVNAWFSGKVLQAWELGSHSLFLADIEGGEIMSGKEPATYAFYHKNIKPRPQAGKRKGWRCKICGYVYEGEELPPDYVCPLCKHGASDFERIE